MKALKKKIEEVLEKINEKIDRRFDSFSDKSDKYQESEAGVAYEDKTDKMQEVADNLELTAESIDEFLEL